MILFVVDIRVDLTSDDFHAAMLLRKSKKPVILVANKCDNPSYEEQRFNMFQLGFGEPLPVSAIHSMGIGDLESKIEEKLTALKFEKDLNEDDVKGIKIAFVGRPNVGKSTMVNAILGKNEVVTSEIPGTTRDSTEIPFKYDKKDFV